MTRTPIMITIDGPSGSGKSTLSRLLAKSLGYSFLDTGAMYRAVGYKVIKDQIDEQDEEAMAAMLDNLDLHLLPGNGDTMVLLDDRDISQAIRTAEMGLVASRVSAIAAVRRKLTELQRRIGREGNFVAEGRDMGTVVFPDAPCKFFLDATPEERARRRTAQLAEKGEQPDRQSILAQIKKRDHDDSNRDLAPLKASADSVCIDSTNMTIEEVLAFMIRTVQTKRGV
ncbi:MAG: (d)CMP kinase [Deltaproteobacteria bacterium]